MLLETLAQKIRSRREKCGLKQQDIANALQVSPQAVSKWERGENAPDIAILGPLARLLGVSTDWLLSVDDARKDVFEATVLVSSVRGAYEKSLGMRPGDFAVWANGLFFQLTEITLRHDGVPIKYMGDQYLCFFSGAEHRERAVKVVLGAKAMVSDDLKAGLSSGEVYLGTVGHPDYARPDIMGETVNAAFLTMQWADGNAQSGIGATEDVVRSLATPCRIDKGRKVKFRGIRQPVTVHEIHAEE